MGQLGYLGTEKQDEMRNFYRLKFSSYQERFYKRLPPPSPGVNDMVTMQFRIIRRVARFCPYVWPLEQIW